MGSACVWRVANGTCRALSLSPGEPFERSARVDGNRRLSFRLHTAQNEELSFNSCWRFSGSRTAIDRLGSRTRNDRRWGLGPFCNSFSLAISTLSCDRLDVPRRLHARGHSHASRSRAGWSRNSTANSCLHIDVAPGQFASDGTWHVGGRLFHRRDGPSPTLSLRQRAGCAFPYATGIEEMAL